MLPHAADLSALVIAATPMSSGEPEAEAAYGAGEVNQLPEGRGSCTTPDASEADYIAFQVQILQGYTKVLNLRL